MVSATMASVTELFGRFKAPETFRLVVVAEVIVVPAKLVTPVIFKFVPVAEVKFRLEKKAFVEVTDVPVAVVNPKAPDSIPPVSKR